MKNLQDLEESNRAKYGEKEFDQIAENYRISKFSGDTWCAENVKRYLNRFKRPMSSKADNMIDLYKAKDYLERMIAENEKFLPIDATKIEIIEKFER